MDKDLEETKALLKKYGQEHLLNHYEKLDDAKKKELLNQIPSYEFSWGLLILAIINLL